MIVAPQPTNLGGRPTKDGVPTRDWLLGVLSSGPMPWNQIVELGKDKYHRTTLLRAFRGSTIIEVKARGTKYWMLPGQTINGIDVSQTSVPEEKDSDDVPARVPDVQPTPIRKGVPYTPKNETPHQCFERQVNDLAANFYRNGTVDRNKLALAAQDFIQTDLSEDEMFEIVNRVNARYEARQKKETPFWEYNPGDQMAALEAATDNVVQALYTEVRNKKWDETQKPTQPGLLERLTSAVALIQARLRRPSTVPAVSAE